MLTHKKGAFTLTEIILAVVIVGVIAALVLPAVVTKYQNHIFDLAFKREVNTIGDLIDQLAVDEHQTSFHNTIMFLDEEPESYDDSSGAFLKKYMRVSKYCGDTKTGCFYSKYHKIANRTKEEYSFTPKGSCAILKNGMSICISPQVDNTAIQGWIDLNGKKAPNVYGRDLRDFSIDLQTKIAFSNDTKKIKLYCDDNPDAAVCKTTEDEEPGGPEGPGELEEPEDECPAAPTVRGDAYWTKCCPKAAYASLEICQSEPEDECPTPPTNSSTKAYGQKCCKDSRYSDDSICKTEFRISQGGHWYGVDSNGNGGCQTKASFMFYVSVKSPFDDRNYSSIYKIYDYFESKYFNIALNHNEPETINFQTMFCEQAENEPRVTKYSYKKYYTIKDDDNQILIEGETPYINSYTQSYNTFLLTQ